MSMSGRGAPPFLIPQQSLFTARVPFADGDLEATHRAMSCHKTQYGQESVDRVNSSMRTVLKGELPLTPMIPQPPTNDLFR